MGRDRHQIAHPIQRLGRWDHDAFVPVTRDSVEATAVHVFVHGWGRGLSGPMKEAGGFMYVWDERATTPEGARFDRWFAPLAEAITSADPEAVVLVYSWVDESATPMNALSAIRSQLRTTVNGQRLAVALERALSDGDHRIHLLGYSHGAKVATIAATLLEPAPAQLTILDSPESALPVLGGALNDLTGYLRVLASGRADDVTFVDNYVSEYGMRYGERAGLGAVVDTVLDPGTFPLERAGTGHSYAWAWYVESAEQLDRGVGFAWSPLVGDPATPMATQLRQLRPRPDALPHPLALEPAPYVRTGGVAERVGTRLRNVADQTRTLETDGGSATAWALFWRRKGDLLAPATVHWISGPDDATLRIIANRTERARTVKGWTDGPDQRVNVPLGGALNGPMVVQVVLESSEPAAVEMARAAAVYSMMLPGGAEMRTWLRPMLLTMVGVSLAGAVSLALRRGRRR